MIERPELWYVIAALAVGSFGLRFVFIGLVGDRPLPEWLLRHLRFTAVAILPALVAPLVVWPSATGGEFDVPRFGAAVVTLVVGLLTRQTLTAILCGAVTLFGLLYLVG
ncbi:AzlD domain-containing protein [Pseudooceanicola aestuarii]|uniref:AzlD domain-containing protein n=1 Tax=Pseudooceanicola aestuarii TaxID=2697319 RepID=UPI0013D6BD9B|nr:AzlD domain-containing protein [Pseudooceanicola aestuarii]